MFCFDSEKSQGKEEGWTEGGLKIKKERKPHFVIPLNFILKRNILDIFPLFLTKLCNFRFVLQKENVEKMKSKKFQQFSKTKIDKISLSLINNEINTFRLLLR